ncbi:hypothetical protein Syun_029666 [Stephania yunnanensis]|uniref:DYW domain-containing protein n=1 Tax=Stephania yunnanensis TaxID=152371 RepID=A0AAP0EAG8_9MAGN
MAATRTSCSTSPHPFTIQRLQKPTSTPPQIKLNLDETKQVHAHLLKTIFSHETSININLFSNHSSPAAQFNFLINNYIKNNYPEEALNIYAYMRNTGTNVDNFTTPSVLKACAQLSWAQQGEEIHSLVLKTGLYWDAFVSNALIQMYTQCGNMVSARKVFEIMPERDVVSWSTMIRSYGRSKWYTEALDLIREMHVSKIKPSQVALINMINLFADLADRRIARPMHAYVMKNNSEAGSDVLPLTTALIDMYAKCGSATYARSLFDRLIMRNIVTLTAMIAGHLRCREVEEAAKLFVEMQKEGIYPNDITMLSVIKECGFTRDLELGKQSHAYMLRNGFDFSSTMATALVDMYGKCGDLQKARALFDGANNRDVLMWTAMISGYAEAKRVNQAFSLFVQMSSIDAEPNEVTMVTLLSLCAEVGALDLGKLIHSCVEKRGVLSDVMLKTSLIEMYAKSGDIEQARRVFDRADFKDIGLWNSMINALAMHGYGEEALELFFDLEKSETDPDEITFVAALHACSHAGLVTEGKRLFYKMTHEFKMEPSVEHYGCMVDLLGRAGLLDVAYEMIKRMSIKPNIVIWGALLAACKLHKNLRLAELVANQLLEIEPQNSGYNTLMSNIYAAASRWNEVAEVRKAMKDEGIKKAPGTSSIEVNGTLHEFIMGDASHPRAKQILEKLAEMNKKLKRAGYVADTSVVLLNIDEEEKETALTYHSEKLAMAFGLISTAPSMPIRVVKNLRICDDCHSATKLLSLIYKRVIIVRDRNRFHHFSEGSCSCGDYW